MDYTQMWKEKYMLAKEYYIENNNLQIPRGYIKNGIKLGEWLQHQRSYYKKNKLSSERIKKLKEIGIIWNVKESTWNDWYSLAKEYYEKNGNLDIPLREQFKGKNLGRWLENQRMIYKKKQKGCLTLKKIKMLEKIGMKWDYIDEWWNKGYEEAKLFYKNHRHLGVPGDYISKSGYCLGIWITHQRSNYNGTSKRGKITEEQIKKLNEIDMMWDNHNEQSQTSFPEQALFYYLNKIFPECENRNNKFGFEMDIYIPSKNIGIEYCGGYHHKKKLLKDLQKYKMAKEIGIEIIYVKEPGLDVFNNEIKEFYLDKNNYDNFNEVIKNIILYINGKIPKNIKIDVVTDRYNIMEQYIKYSDLAWEEKYKLAKEYYKENGNLKISKNYEINGVKLGSWIGVQRQVYKENRYGILTKYQIEQLNKIGMVWDGEKEIKDKWNEYYNLAKEHYIKNGNININTNYVVDGYNLGDWIKRQRDKYFGKNVKRTGKLSKEQIKLLEDIGINWDKLSITDNKWMFAYNLAKEYYIENGNLDIPYSYVLNNYKLGHWLYIQKRKRKLNNKKLGILKKKQIELLNKIDIKW